MLLGFFPKLIGYRRPLLNAENLHDYVEVLVWYHPEFTPVGHTALRIVKSGKEVAYLSFSPKSLLGVEDQPLSKLRHGIPAVFINGYEDELLIQGFKNQWPEIKSELNPAQLSILEKNAYYLKHNSLKKISGHLLLEIIKLTDERSISRLKARGSLMKLFNCALLILKRWKKKLIY